MEKYNITGQIVICDDSPTPEWFEITTTFPYENHNAVDILIGALHHVNKSLEEAISIHGCVALHNINIERVES